MKKRPWNVSRKVKMKNKLIISNPFLDLKIKELQPYQQIFIESQIQGRSRIIDTSHEEWDIGETEALKLNFFLVETSNEELLDQFKYVMAWFVKSKSPGHSISTFSEVTKFINSCESFDDESGDDLADALADEVLYYFVNNRKQHDEKSLNSIRLWYQKGTKLKLPMFQKSVANALDELKLKGLSLIHI